MAETLVCLEITEIQGFRQLCRSFRRFSRYPGMMSYQSGSATTTIFSSTLMTDVLHTDDQLPFISDFRCVRTHSRLPLPRIIFRYRRTFQKMKKGAAAR